MKKVFLLFCQLAIFTSHFTFAQNKSNCLWIDKFDQSNFKALTGGNWYTFTDSSNGGGSKINVDYRHDAAKKSQVIHYSFQLKKAKYQWTPYAALSCFITTENIPDQIEAIVYEFKGSKHSLLYRTSSIADYAFYQKETPESKEWKTISIPLTELKQPFWGRKAKFIPDDLSGLTWQIVGNDNDSGEVYIDNIRFIYAKSKEKKVSVEKQLKGFDERLTKIMSDWNLPGCAIGIVKDGKLVYAKGFGYRDLENKLPVTPNTIFPIGSNTKLFTATTIGLLVKEGKLDWDKPIKSLEPSINFFSEDLNKTVSLRDMLSHRIGIPRYDMLWYRMNFTRQELFDRMKYLEPTSGYRSSFQYNNLMYAAAGHIIFLKTDTTWEDYLSKKILSPLKMDSTSFSIEEMEKNNDYAKPYYSQPIKPYIFYRQMQGVGPAGSMNSNINDLSKWVICQLANGKFEGKQVVPSSVIQETLKPTTILGASEYKEMSFDLYGLGRFLSTYKGHSMNSHGGVIDGFVSQIAMFPDDGVGIIILTNAYGQYVPMFLQYEIADRVLGLDKTQWHEKAFDLYNKNKEPQTASKTSNKDSIAPKPSRILTDYVGEYVNPIYGKIEIKSDNDSLLFNFHTYHLPLTFVKENQFSTPETIFRIQHIPTFIVRDNGKIEKLELKLDGKQVQFTKLQNSISITDK